MLSLLEQIDKGTLWPSPGGIHPPENKHQSNQNPIDTIKLADEYVIPVPTAGQNCTLTVAIGDKVFKGTALTKGNRHLPCHAPTSGTVTAIETRASNHASGLPVLSIIIQPDQQDQWLPSLNDHNEASNDESLLVERIRQSGVAGMGGAAFPSHIKLSPNNDIELLIINGIECEPFITADDRLMREHASKIIEGIELIEQLLSPLRVVIAIEDNKPQAISAMQSALADNSQLQKKARVTAVPTKYPSGGEKQLIQIITGREVPSGGIPAQLGIVVHNVGTAFAINEAVKLNKPLIERVVTVTGANVSKPGNYWVPIGTPIAHLLKQAGVKAEPNQKYIVGGPMMGYELVNVHSPILKGTNCILAPSSAELAIESQEKSCIRCGECAVVCPANLLPQQLFWHSKAQEYDKATSYNLKDCIECGCCSYVCPSDIPLVQYYRVAKSAIKAEEQSKLEAEQAKIRFDARIERLEKQKLEREQKAKKAAESRKAKMNAGGSDAVAAALARVKAKKEQQAAADNTETETTDKKSQVAAAIARAKAKKLAQAQQSNNESAVDDIDTAQSNVDDKKAKVAAAIARAKAKKQAAISEDLTAQVTNEPLSEADEKKAKVAAAIARAKAKKAKLAATSSESQSEHSSDTKTEPQIASVNNDSEPSATDEKKAKIAAAVAKAKAKKAKQKAETEQIKSNEVKAETKVDAQIENKVTTTISAEQETESLAEVASQSTPTLSAQEQKKAKIAAAVAKAKLKAQQKAAAKAVDEEKG
ncbi:MAG: electron transport complex subunit RsxC [Parashewanella sp.]